jgi:hypothetical protein
VNKTQAMIRACHRRQWPTEYGRPFIPEPSSEELQAVRPAAWPDLVSAGVAWSTYCDRCGCDHGTIPMILEYGEAG